MPVPYRKTPRAAEIGLAAYLDIVESSPERVFHGGLLILDGKGQPHEFVHNRVIAPEGVLWSAEWTRAMATVLLAHSLFDACRREPDLLVALPTLGSAEYGRVEIAPAVPFARVVPPREGIPAEWSWVSDPPTPGMRAMILAHELARRGFITEPFERLRRGLRLVYPNADPAAFDLHFDPEPSPPSSEPRFTGVASRCGSGNRIDSSFETEVRGDWEGKPDEA